MKYELNSLKDLTNQNINTIEDLFFCVPKSYDNFKLTNEQKLANGQVINIVGHIVTDFILMKHKTVYSIRFEVKTKYSKYHVIVFRRNAFLITKQFKKDDEVLINGKFDFYKNQIVANIITKRIQDAKILPHYKINGVADYIITKTLKKITDDKLITITENLPQKVVYDNNFISEYDAYFKLHFPSSMNDIFKSHQRLKYVEAFNMQIKLLELEVERTKRSKKNYDINPIKEYIKTIPYELTNDQKNAANSIFRDFKSDKSCYRLIQGDVGSGKTVVAAIAILGAITANEQVAFLVPTEILAKQHYEYFKCQFKNLRVELLTSKSKDKEIIKEKIKNNEVDLVIGTHTLSQTDLEFSNLGLVVIDEQHRFGVNIREKLIEKSKTKDVIYLTATPIPRTLGIVLFGNMDISIIKEKPKNRKEVITTYLSDEKIDVFYDKMKEVLEKNEQIYIITPAIDSILKDENIKTLEEKITSRFNNKLFIIHGKMNKDEQDLALDNFMNTKSSILLATTMVEVGINIPNATLIGIFGAENFGLSQLHQLRGRVGRSDKLSYCYLISKKEDVERLNILVNTSDGFLLSEYDLKERGPGDFLGLEQSGYLKFNFLDMVEDFNVLIQAKNDIKKYVKK